MEEIIDNTACVRGGMTSKGQEQKETSKGAVIGA